MTERNEPEPETVVVKAAKVEGPWSHWPNYVVGLAALAISVTFFFSARADLAAAAERQETAECHTSLMNRLHTNLDRALFEHPENIEAGLEQWPGLFQEWREQLPTCRSQQH